MNVSIFNPKLDRIATFDRANRKDVGIVTLFCDGAAELWISFDNADQAYDFFSGIAKRLKPESGHSLTSASDHSESGKTHGKPKAETVYDKEQEHG